MINNIVLFGIMIIQMIMIFTNNGPMESYLELQVLTYILDLYFQGICAMFKHALKTLLDDFGLLSKDVAEMLVQMYQVNPSPAILDLSKQVNHN